MELLSTDKSIEPVSEGTSITALTRGLTSADAAERHVALEELIAWDDNDAFSLFGSLFDDSSAETRSAAARALYEFRSDRATSFTRVMREASTERRRNIAAALGRFGPGGRSHSKSRG